MLCVYIYIYVICIIDISWRFFQSDLNDVFFINSSVCLFDESNPFLNIQHKTIDLFDVFWGENGMWTIYAPRLWRQIVWLEKFVESNDFGWVV